VDACIPAWGLVLEADGRRWHARVEDFDRDRWRDNQAAALGLRVMRFTHVHLVHRQLEVIRLIVDAGRTAAPRAA
jgi:very-short-patch-repair endonuclease